MLYALLTGAALALTPGCGGKGDLLSVPNGGAVGGMHRVAVLPNSIFDARPIFVSGDAAAAPPDAEGMMLYHESPSSVAVSSITRAKSAVDEPTWQAGGGGKGDLVTSYVPRRVNNIPNSKYDARPIVVPSPASPKVVAPAAVDESLMAPEPAKASKPTKAKKVAAAAAA
jgi:hypothetical protein